MAGDEMLALPTRRQVMGLDDNGFNVWRSDVGVVRRSARETALVLCDVWDRHWCRAAETRLERLLPRMQQVVGALRRRGTLIVHAPSETMAFYAGSPARRRAQEAPPVAPPPDLACDEPPLPFDARDGSCDAEQEPPQPPYPWTRQHPAIEIDQAVDAVSDNGLEHYALYRQRGIAQVLIMGVHTNMCILNRSFAIKQLVRRGIPVALIRDLTDAMYNPARPPYVSHDEGTRLVVEYIEKFWCPTVTSADVVGE